MVRAVILAAGASSRMGRPKAGLPLRHRADTFLSRSIQTLIIAGLPEIVVVTGASADAVRQAAGPPDRRVRFVHNPAWETGQLSSILAGLDGGSDRAFRADVLLEALLVGLVDVPLVSPATVVRVVTAWRLQRPPVARPVRGDDHGHPVVFDRAVFDALRAADPSVGAKAVVRAHERHVLNVAVDDPGAFVDVDTPEAYRVQSSKFKVQSSKSELKS